MFNFDDKDIDHLSFVNTALVVLRHNKSARERLYDIAGIYNDMVGNTIYLTKPGYLSINGYVLSAYQKENGKLGVRASVDHSLFISSEDFTALYNAAEQLKEGVRANIALDPYDIKAFAFDLGDNVLQSAAGRGKSYTI